MKTPGPDWRLEDDLKSVTVTFPTDPPVALRLDATGVDDLLKNLGLFRGAMQPPHPKEWKLGQRAEAIPGPAWATEPDLMHGHSLIHLRDPRFGWLHYLLPPEDASKLSALLKVQVDSQPPTQAPGKPS